MAPSAQVEIVDGRLRLTGDLTVYSTSELRHLLYIGLPAGDGPVELDLSEVTELDTAGLQLLMLLRRRASGAGRELRIMGESSVARQTLRILGLTDLLTGSS